MSKLLHGKSVLITGGTGSLGGALVKRIVTGEYGTPLEVVIFSRDELKQAEMASEYKNTQYIRYVIGDVRDYQAISNEVIGADIIFHAAAMKRVGSCEVYPDEAVETNYRGASNIVRAIKHIANHVSCVIGVSSDKGAEPLNVYGMTKALQEHRLLIANKECKNTRFVCVRYGNVMGSRGSVIPIWKEQAKSGVITITDSTMTRFLLTLDQAVDTLIDALATAKRGEVYIPSYLPAATIGSLAYVIGGCGSNYKYIGRGHGEKTHETLITDDEINRTIKRGKYFAVGDTSYDKPAITKKYVSSDYVIGTDKLRELLIKLGVI